MAEQFEPLQPKRFPQSPHKRVTAEVRYWRTFKCPKTIQHIGGVSAIAFSPSAPHDFCATSSTRVHVYSGATGAEKKKLSRFHDVVHAAAWRKDGRMLAAAGESKIVRVFDVSTRSLLREFKGHEAAVRAISFGLSQTRLTTAGHDSTVRLWDVSTGDQTECITAHSDYIRCLVDPIVEDGLWGTGSYDHTVKLWDTRSSATPTFTLNHGAPVEDALMLPGGSLVVTAGGNYLKVWDVVGGGSCIRTVSNHQKTITAIQYDSMSSRLLSGSLDNHLKVYDIADYKVTHSMDVGEAILSLGLSADNMTLAVGTATGALSIRRRKTPKPSAQAAQDAQSRQILRSGSYKYFLRGHNRKIPNQDEFKVEQRRRVRLKPYDKMLQKFEYMAALDAALATKQPLVIVSVLEELRQRDGLTIACGGRDDEGMVALLSFLLKYISNPRYTQLLIDIAGLLLDLYGPVLGQSATVDELFLKLQQRVYADISFMKQLYPLQGILELIMASNALQ